jgi:hypothetical protein
MNHVIQWSYYCTVDMPHCTEYDDRSRGGCLALAWTRCTAAAAQILTASSLANRAGMLSHLDDINLIVGFCIFCCLQYRLGQGAAAAPGLAMLRVRIMCGTRPLFTTQTHFKRNSWRLQVYNKREVLQRS